MATFLIGGLLLFAVLISVIRPSEAIRAIQQTPSSSDLISLYSGLAMAVLSIPMGYLINQIWMAIYNAFIDVHIDVFSIPKDLGVQIEKLEKSGSRWQRGYLNEVRLALFHRKEARLDSEQFLSWHRNRLNALHSNGSAVLGCVIGLSGCIIISQFTHLTSWITHPFSQYIRERWWFVASIAAALFLSICRMVREYRLIVLYNRMAITDSCNKCPFKCWGGFPVNGDNNSNKASSNEME